MSTKSRGAHTFIALGTLSPIQCEASQAPPIQVQRPRCIPRNCGTKQTNIPYKAKQNLNTGVENQL